VSQHWERMESICPMRREVVETRFRAKALSRWDVWERKAVVLSRRETASRSVFFLVWVRAWTARSRDVGVEDEEEDEEDDDVLDLDCGCDVSLGCWVAWSLHVFDLALYAGDWRKHEQCHA